MAKKKQTQKSKNAENLVHIRYGPGELVRSKREILNSEASLIRALKALSNYKNLRSHELKLKKEFLRNLREARIELDKTKRLLPIIPKKIKKKLDTEEKEEPREKNSTKKADKNKQVSEKQKEEKSKSDDLDSQLAEIQNKLKELEGQA
ncbi:MAG: hypothetical protein ABEI74_01800 [Candidatus Pacearchaeota archaeon]